MELPVKYSSLSAKKKKEVKDAYLSLQKGQCWYCRCPLEGPPSNKVKKALIYSNLFPESFFKWPVHLHHDHKTGLTVGLVHNRCNAYLWQYLGK